MKVGVWKYSVSNRASRFSNEGIISFSESVGRLSLLQILALDFTWYEESLPSLIGIGVLKLMTKDWRQSVRI